MRIVTNNKWITIIFLLGFFLRVVGVFPGYPYYHPDEGQSYSRALDMILSFSLDPKFYGYGSLVPLIHSLFYLLIFIPISILNAIIRNGPIEFFENTNNLIFGTNQINVMYWGRYVNAILGSLTILAVYVFVKKHIGKLSTALIASLLIAINWRHVLSSHFALFDITNGLLLLISIYFALNLLTDRNIKSNFKASFVSALLASVKFSPLGLISSFIAIILSTKVNLQSIKSSIVSLMFIGTVFVSSILVLNLYHFINLNLMLKDVGTLDARYSIGINQLTIFPYIYLYRFGLGELTTIFSIVGILVFMIKSFKKFMVIIFPLTLFFYILTYYSVGGVYIRNFVGVIPFLIIFSSYGIVFAYERFYKINKFVANIILLVVLTIITSSQLVNTLEVNSNYSKKWNVEILKKNLPIDISNHKISGTDWFINYILGNDFKNKVTFSKSSLYTLSELQRENVEYAIIDTDIFEPDFNWWMSTRGDFTMIDMPTDLLYQTLSGSSLREILTYTEVSFLKPYQAPDTNFFIVRIPDQLETDGEGEIIYSDDFDTQTEWNVKSGIDLTPLGIGQIFDNKCKGKGCVVINPIVKNGSIHDIFSSSYAPHFYRFTSPSIPVLAGRMYRVSSDMMFENRNDTTPDGFFKIDLFSDSNSANSDVSGDYVYLSDRHFGENNKWKTYSRLIVVPKSANISVMTVSFQTDSNMGAEFYYDNLVVEEFGDSDFEYPQKREFPLEYIFPKSIL